MPVANVGLILQSIRGAILSESGEEMIHASLRMKFASDKLAQAREILCAIVERTRVHPGCLGCDVYQDLLDPVVLMFEEWWKSSEDLNQHLRSESYRRVILVMELAAEYPVIRFSEVTKTTGMETIRNSRFGLPSGPER